MRIKKPFVTDARQIYFALLLSAFRECGALFLIFLQIAVSAINIGTPKISIQIVYAIKNALHQNSAHNHGNLRALPSHTADHIAARMNAHLLVRFSSINVLCL